MRERLLGSRGIGLITAALLGGVAGLALHATGGLSWLESKTVDARFSLRGQQPFPRNVVVVGVDNTSVGRLPRYPFPRRYAARALDNLHAAGARLIAYDVSFDSPTDTADDLSLYEAARRAAPVVFGTTLITSSGDTAVFGGAAHLQTIGARAGAADLPVDADGVVRRPLAEIHHLPSFASAVAADLGTVLPSEDVVRRAYIDFHGPSGTVPSIPFWRAAANQLDPRTVRGKVIVVGLTASVLQDVHATAIGGGPLPGPEIQAEAIATALGGYPLRDAPSTATILTIVLLALVVPLLDATFGSVVGGLGAIVALVAWTVAAQLMFGSGSVVDYTSASSAVLISSAGVIGIEAITDSRERRRLRTLFAGGAPDVVRHVLEASGRTLGPTGIIAGYRIDEEIGRGGMGVVYRATQLALDRPVAIKLISTDKTGDPVFQERFKRESRLAAAVEHPNVVPVFEAGEDDGLLFIAMRYVDGIDLGAYLRTSGALPLALTARLTVQLASALDAAHALGLVHRDVKPANVLLTTDAAPHAYLTDFGVAMRLMSATRVTQAGALVGTLDYMAPEQMRGEDADHRADIYSLAALLYHCLTGEPPYPRDQEAAKLWAHMNAPPPAPSRVRPGLPAELDKIVAIGLAKLPADRYSEAGALASAVARVAGTDSQVVATRPTDAADVRADPLGGPTIAEGV